MQFFEIILSAFILIGSSILGFVLPYKEGNSLWTIFSICWLFIEPTKMFFRRQYNKITSNWYYVTLLFLEVLILCFMFICRSEISFWIVYMCLLLLVVVSFFSKKKKYTCEINLSRWLFFMIGVIAFATYFSQISMSIFEQPIGIIFGIISLFLSFTVDRLSKEQGRGICIILMLFALIIKQPICFILLIRSFLDFDYN